MGFSEDQIILWAQQFAYQPYWVYGAVVAFMVASSFGLPLPEELTLLGTGFVCFVGSRPDLYPPPMGAGDPVQVEVAALVAFAAVFLSDFLVFTLGRFFGTKLMTTKFFSKNQATFDKVSLWVKKYGMWAAGIFRFTPGLRFPGHFSCGMLGLKQSQFILVDGLAAMVSVPTQVFLIAIYGQEILEHIREVKGWLLVVIGIGLVLYLGYKFYRKRNKTVSA